MWHYAKDQQKHGPVTQDALLGMLRSGALADHDLVWREGMTSWQAAGEVMELQRALFASRAPAESGGPGGSVVATQPQNGMAITSLVLGIVSIMVGTLIITALPGVICGHIAKRQIRESTEGQSGEGMATAGLILGYISIILTVALGVLLGVLFFSLG